MMFAMRSSNHPHRYQALVAAVLVLALGVGGCGRGKKEEAAKNAAPEPITLGPEDTAVVTRAAIQSGPALTGTLTAKEQATVRAQISGSVLETYAEPGQSVHRGEVLARFDSLALTDAYNSARAGVANARNNLAVARREAERQRVLEQAGAVAQRNVETAQQSVVQAQTAVAQAQAQLASAEKQLTYTRLTAPFSGVVSERPINAGDVVQPGTAVYTIVDPSSLQLEAALPAEQIGQFRVGTPVEFTVTGYPQPFRGSVTRINPIADPATRQVRVYAEIPNPGNDLVSGLYAEGRVESESRTALTLPAGAIDRRLAKPAVLRVKDGKVERVEVQVGLVDDREQRVEVLRGVQPGDVILVGAAQEIEPGTPVRLPPSVQQQSERLAQAL
jgi:membrane fusion protein (multidrug efflux system)